MAGIGSSRWAPNSRTPANSQGSIAQDKTLAHPPGDSISAMSFSPIADNLAVASWDNSVRIYDLSTNPLGDPSKLLDFDGPVLGCDWSKDGTMVVGAGTDKTARVLDLGSNNNIAQQVAAHDAPIRSVRFCKLTGAPMLVTGSWDNTIKYWDMRQATPVGTVQLKERVYSMDVCDGLLAIATADNKINLINLRDHMTIYAEKTTKLNHQLRVVRTFPNRFGFAVGGIEAKVDVQYLLPSQKEKDICFKCQRSEMVNNVVECFAVNDVSFHPIHHTMSTAGADGTFSFWDQDSRRRLKAFPAVGGSISATAFNHDGTKFAYAVSYDWSKGHAFNTPDYPTKIMWHSVGYECEPTNRPLGHLRSSSVRSLSR